MEVKNAEIVQIGELKEFANDFKVVEFVIKDTTTGQYEQFLTLQAVKDKAENLIKYNKVGDLVDVSINVGGRAYTKDGETKYFNQLTAWKVFKAGVQQAAEKIDEKFEPAEDLNEDDHDDLPF